MAAKVGHAQSETGKVPVKPMLDMLLLYEDLGTALRVKHLLHRLPSRLGAGTGLTTRSWRLGLLRQPLLAEQAAIEAAAADVIVLSLHNRRQLQAELRDWSNRWLDHKEDRPYALAALLDPEPVQAGSDNPVIAYLQRLAATAGADLFWGACARCRAGVKANRGRHQPRRTALPRMAPRPPAPAAVRSAKHPVE
jgi:hypothetical protein